MNEIRNLLIGFELNRDSCQLSYYERRAGEPVSVPVKVGTNLYTFPTHLTKIAGKEEWHFGLEADYFGSRDNGVPVPDLYDVFCGADDVEVDGRRKTPAALLAVFLEKALALTGVRDVIRAISHLTVTTRSLTKGLVDNLRTACFSLGLSPEALTVQNHMESFYYYVYSQKPELCTRDAILYEFDGDTVSCVSLTMDRTTRPASVRLLRGGETQLPAEKYARDEAFLAFAGVQMNRRLFSSVYLCGSGFDVTWADRSTAFLCQSRRHVFSGENLYVRGACYTSLEKQETHSLKGQLYMGDDLVRTNLGMEMVVRGVPSYYPLISAGRNWFDADKYCEFILDNTDSLTFSLNPISGRDKRQCRMDLPGLPDRPNRTTRLSLRVSMLSPTRCLIRVEDLGFGGFYPPAGLVWQEELDL